MYADAGASMGRYPPDLDLLLDGFVEHPHILECPTANETSGPPPHSSHVYKYVPGHTQSHGHAVLAICPHCGAGRGINALMGDGHVEWLSYEEGGLEAALRKLNVPLDLKPDMTPEQHQEIQLLRTRLGLPVAPPAP
ncbi:MAG: hypothetical protein AMXMBFR7_03030 [Planctomycetota bacterium]